MSTFKKYKRTAIAEMRPVTEEEIKYSMVHGAKELIFARGISVSKADIEADSPKIGDMIARNPKNHQDQWLVNAKYVKDNFELMKE